MALSTPNLLTAVSTMVSGLSGIGAVYVGVPEAVSPQLGAYITLGAQSFTDYAFRVEFDEVRIRVVFVYAVEGAEANAEMGIATALDTLRAALKANRTLSGTCKHAAMDTASSAAPDYEPLLGQEFRRYPVDIVCTDDEAA